MTADFLLELRSEEIPARMQAAARNALGRMLAEELAAGGIEAEAIDVWSTPRRLALVARGLPLETQASAEEVKGPRTSAPAQALDGFLRKTGLTRDQLEDRDGVWFAVVETAGRPTAELLGHAVERIVRGFAWPKSMRWGTSELRWVRPLHGIVAMLGEAIVPVAIDGIEAGATTVGHRFHHPGPITLGGAHDYVEKLRACHVIVDQEEREALIRDGAAKAAAEAGLTLVEDEGLVVENAGLTEWPVPLLGRFDPDFLDVPREVIVLTMRTNQKYFACGGEDGALAPAFVCVANIDAHDGGAAIVEGNKRVLAARLSDARFFWEQDLKVPLEEQAKKLSGIVFHEKLGTVADKVERVAKLAEWSVTQGIVKGCTAADARQAAELCKADLVTGMVGEFPELQGVIGGYLAAAQGEPRAIADAVRDHYKPVGQGDEVPTAPVTVAVSYADKLDTLVGFFANGFAPSGSGDPYGLRRTLLGLLRLILENKIRVDLAEEYVETIGLFFGPLPDPSRPAPDGPFLDLAALARDPNVQITVAGGRTQVFRGDELLASVAGEFATVERMAKRTEKVWAGNDKLLDFTQDRLKALLASTGIRHHVTAAAAAIPGERLPEFDVTRLFSRARALQSLLETSVGADLLAGYKRAANILKREDWTAPEILSSEDEQGIPQTGEEDPLVLVEEPGMAEAIAELASGSAGAFEPHEAALVAALDAAEPKASAAVEAEDFTGAMAALASLRKPIDEFFEHVTVNDPDPAKRERRLNLLLRFRDAVHRVADFSKIEG